MNGTKYCPYCKKGDDRSEYRQGIIQACSDCANKLKQAFAKWWVDFK